MKINTFFVVRLEPNACTAHSTRSCVGGFVQVLAGFFVCVCSHYEKTTQPSSEEGDNRICRTKKKQLAHKLSCRPFVRFRVLHSVYDSALQIRSKLAALWLPSYVTPRTNHEHCTWPRTERRITNPPRSRSIAPGMRVRRNRNGAERFVLCSGRTVKKNH